MRCVYVFQVENVHLPGCMIHHVVIQLYIDIRTDSVHASLYIMACSMMDGIKFTSDEKLIHDHI